MWKAIDLPLWVRRPNLQFYTTISIYVQAYEPNVDIFFLQEVAMKNSRYKIIFTGCKYNFVPWIPPSVNITVSFSSNFVCRNAPCFTKEFYIETSMLWTLIFETRWIVNL